MFFPDKNKLEKISQFCRTKTPTSMAMYTQVNAYMIDFLNAHGTEDAVTILTSWEANSSKFEKFLTKASKPLKDPTKPK